jgi:hypothetical protein
VTIVCLSAAQRALFNPHVCRAQRRTQQRVVERLDVARLRSRLLHLGARLDDLALLVLLQHHHRRCLGGQLRVEHIQVLLACIVCVEAFARALTRWSCGARKHTGVLGVQMREERCAVLIGVSVISDTCPSSGSSERDS